LAHGDIAVVTRRQAALPIDFPVGKRHRQDRPPRRQRRLDQGGMKMQQTPAIGRRSFGKNGDVLAFVEKLGDLLIDHLGVTATAAPQKHRIVLRRQPADQRPVAHLFLRYEGRRQDGVDDIDVDPRDVIGDEQGTGNGMRQVSLDVDAQGVEQGRSPTGLERHALRLAAQWKKTERQDRRTEHQQGNAENPESADRDIGLAQSAYPR